MRRRGLEIRLRGALAKVGYLVAAGAGSTRGAGSHFHMRITAPKPSGGGRLSAFRPAEWCLSFLSCSALCVTKPKDHQHSQRMDFHPSRICTRWDNPFLPRFWGLESRVQHGPLLDFRLIAVARVSYRDGPSHQIPMEFCRKVEEESSLDARSSKMVQHNSLGWSATPTL